MTICLVGAPIITEFEEAAETDSEQSREIAAQPQLGMLVLAAALEAAGHGVKIVNLNRGYYGYIESDAVAYEDFSAWASRHIASEQADVYGFSSICSSYPLSLRIANLVKNARPDSTLIFGGPQASVVDVETLTTFPFVDLIVRGEADRTLPALLAELSGQRRIQLMPGITYRSGKRVLRNPNAPPVADLDTLPLPAFQHVDNMSELRSVSVELGRGCPFACKFCSTNDFFRRDFRVKSAARMLAELRHMSRNYGVRRFELVHDMFTVDRKRVVAFCQAMLDSGDDFKWSCSARTDCVDDALLELMAKAGCTAIFLGVETGSARMQKVIDKHLDVAEAHAVMDAVERHSMNSTVSLITGFPEEQPADLRDTLHFYMRAVKTPHADPQLNILAPLAATPIHHKHRDELVLGDLCSEVSHQGRFQNAVDRLLIEAHPDIFPNFYLLPTPHLDRAFLLELREFLLTGSNRMRWLLVALHQSTAGILDVFSEWRSHRLALRPGLAGGDLRHYYRLPDFRRDFVAFVESRLAQWSGTAVRALVAYEKALAAYLVRPGLDLAENYVPAGSTLLSTDIPLLTARVELVQMQWDLQAVIQCLQNEQAPDHAANRRVWYVMRPEGNDATRLSEIGSLSALILTLCNGQRNIGEVMRLFREQYVSRQGLGADAVFISLLEALKDRGLLGVHRQTEFAAAQLAYSDAQPAVLLLP